MYQERIEKVLDAMEEMGLDQMLVSDPDSIWYLTGYDVFPFERLFALYLRRDGHHKLFLNRLFPVPEAPCEQVWSSDTDDAVAILAAACGRQQSALGIDEESARRFLAAPDGAQSGQPVCSWHPTAWITPGPAEDEAERELMRAASRINDTVMERAAGLRSRRGSRSGRVADYIVTQYAAEGCDAVALPAHCLLRPPRRRPPS